MLRERQIVQIMPAEGWNAVFVEQLPTGERKLSSEPLACWALVEDEAKDYDRPRRQVVGLAARALARPEVSDCGISNNFVGYLRDGEDIEVWREAAESRFAGQDELQDKREAGRRVLAPSSTP